MNIEKVQLEINGIEFDAEVHFNFTKGEEPVSSQLPENCTPGSDDEWDLKRLSFVIQISKYCTHRHDTSFLLPKLSKGIIEELEILRIGNEC